MSFRFWMFATAIGLILSASSGQAQVQTDTGQNGSKSQEQATNDLPFRIPVQIIEDNEAFEARERSEAEARQHEKDDLAAQQGMNAATQAMNVATQRMALHSLLSTIFVGVGTGLLIWTLCLTRQANRSARKAVDVTRVIGEKQVRAYLTILNVRMTPDKKYGGFSPVISCTIRNSGNSPAKDVLVGYRDRKATDGNMKFSTVPDIEPGGSEDAYALFLEIADVYFVDDDGRAQWSVVAEIVFTDVFEEDRAETFLLAATADLPVIFDKEVEFWRHSGGRIPTKKPNH